MSMLRLLWIFIACIAYQTTVYAGNRMGTGTFSIGPAYGYFSAKRHIENTGFPFIALGYNLTNHWGVEGIVTNFSTDSKRIEDNGKQVKATLFGFDGVYHFSPFNHIEPFILAGVGITGMNPNGTDANNQGNLNVGAGVQYFFHQSIALRLEARDFYTISLHYHDVIMDGGVSFLFDLC